jgi:hypothetical protein
VWGCRVCLVGCRGEKEGRMVYCGNVTCMFVKRRLCYIHARRMRGILTAAPLDEMMLRVSNQA